MHRNSDSAIFIVLIQFNLFLEVSVHKREFSTVRTKVVIGKQLFLAVFSQQYQKIILIFPIWAAHFFSHKATLLLEQDFFVIYLQF